MSITLYRGRSFPPRGERRGVGRHMLATLKESVPPPSPRGASSRAFSRWRTRRVPPISYFYHPMRVCVCGGGGGGGGNFQ